MRSGGKTAFYRRKYMSLFIREIEDFARSKNLDKVFNGLMTDPEFFTRRIPVADSVSMAAYHSHTNQNEQVIEVPLVGIEKENISIEVEQGLLTVNAKTDSKSRFVRDFKHSWLLLKDAVIDEASVEFKNGLLKIVIPTKKKETEKKTLSVK